MKICNIQRACTAIATTILAIALPQGAGATNSVPFASSFELSPDGYMPGMRFTNMFMGWQAGDADSAYITNLYYTADSRYSNSYNNISAKPLPDADHSSDSQVLRLDGGITNYVQSAPGAVYWIDMMLHPVRWTEDTNPNIPSDTHAAFYFNSNGVLRLNFVTNIAENSFSPTSAVWAEIDGVELPSNEWRRITLMLDYANVDDEAGFHFFQFYVNGVAVSSPYGYVTNTGVVSTNQGGTYFAMGNISASQINEIAFRNTGTLDDFVVTNEAPFSGITHVITASASANGAISPSGSVTVADGFDQTFTLTPNAACAVSNIVVDGVTNYTTQQSYTFSTVTADHTISVEFTAPSDITSNGVPHSWLAGFSLATTDAAGDENPDGDLSTTTREYFFGTDPTNAASDARFVRNWITNGLQLISWQGGTNGSANPFQIWCTTNSGAVGGWTNIGVQAHSTTALNVWTNTLPIKGAYYEIRVATP